MLNQRVFNPRIPHQFVIVYGGYEDGFATNTLKTFDPRARTWSTIGLAESFNRVYHKTVAIGNKLYIIGGSDGIHIFKTLIQLNLNKFKFTLKKSMTQVRCYPAAVVYGNCIFVMGGQNGVARLRTCEMYNSVENEWTVLPSMHYVRSDASAVVYKDKIYVAGGIDVYATSSVEVFSMATRSWQVISFMKIPRRSFCLQAYEGKLYAIGGFVDMHDFRA